MNKVILSLSLLGTLAYSSHAGEISSIVTTYQGSSVPIGGSGEFYYNFSHTAPVAHGTAKTFTSRFAFYSAFTAGGGLAQLFRKNIDYKVAFLVEDPEKLGFKLKVHRRVSGRSSIKWTGSSSQNSSKGTIGYGHGLVYVNGVLRTQLRIAGVVSREVNEANPTPEDQNHLMERSLVLENFSGTQEIVINEHEPAAQLTHTYQNYQTGKASMSFGAFTSLTSPTGYELADDGSGDVLTVTVVFNPKCVIEKISPSSARIVYEGVLQEMDANLKWQDIAPQPLSPYTVDFTSARRFFRARSAE